MRYVFVLTTFLMDVNSVALGQKCCPKQSSSLLLLLQEDMRVKNIIEEIRREIKEDIGVLTSIGKEVEKSSYRYLCEVILERAEKEQQALLKNLDALIRAEKEYYLNMPKSFGKKLRLALEKDRNSRAFDRLSASEISRLTVLIKRNRDHKSSKSLKLWFLCKSNRVSDAEVNLLIQGAVEGLNLVGCQFIQENSREGIRKQKEARRRYLCHVNEVVRTVEEVLLLSVP